MPDTFPDEIHLEQVRRHLWSAREVGRAAVMVGAGLSRQAEAIVSNAPPIPLWRDIARELDARLNPVTNRSSIGDEPTSSSGPRLASQYQEVFGRSELDALLLELIPDQQYVPGQLHQHLLALPWADVFTTNYDTLLERTLPRVHDRKYDILLSVSDIPGRVQPRIVKLHGSFPSQRPFIITEEDYRQYPIRFAPFVNTVQQSLMENVFCLVGFSGDDPNFLYWTGWVRDNLGESTPPIYLCGLLDLSVPFRQLLRSRNVVPVDLSAVVPRDRFPDPQQRHSAALEWLIAFLEAGKPPSRLSWPAVIQRSRPSVRAGLPAVSTINETSSDAGPATASPLSADDARALRERWKTTRVRYPGWEVAPYQNRVLLWHDTSPRVEQVLRALAGLEHVERLQSLFELVWRLDIALVPLFVDWLPPITETLEAINPRPGYLDLPTAVVSPSAVEYAALDWGELTMMWAEIAFAIAREARDDLDGARFNLWMDRIRPLAADRSNWLARLTYERCLFHLLQADHEAVRAAVVEWPTGTSPFWETKRAAVLAEVGQLEDAERVAQAALDDIRAREVASVSDLGLLSQEGWTMMLLRSIRQNRIHLGDAPQDERDRWDILAALRCNPRDDLELQAALVNRPVTAPKPERETIRQFDPGISSTTYHLGSRVDEDSILAGFGFLRTFETGALPLRCGFVGMSPSEVAAAADWIEEFAPLWSLGTRLRTGNVDAIGQFFDRALVAGLDQRRFDFLFSVATTSLRQAVARLSVADGGTALANSGRVSVFSEVLSRLTVRASDSQLVEVLDIAISMYQTPAMRAVGFHTVLKHLFDRVIYALPPGQLLARMPDLLLLPIPSASGFDVPHAESWPEPFAVGAWPQRASGSGGLTAAIIPTTGWLVNLVATGNSEMRRRAVIRLLRASQMGLLSEAEQAAFGEALWSRVDTSGLPAETSLFPAAFLTLPAPSSIHVEERLRAYLAAGDFRRSVRRDRVSGVRGFSFFSTPDAYLESLRQTIRIPWLRAEQDRRIEWSAAEAAVVLEKAAAWWHEHKPELTSTGDPLSSGHVTNDIVALLDALAIASLPRLAEADAAHRELAIGLLAEIESAGIRTLAVVPLTIRLGSDPGEAAIRLRLGLFASDELAANGAVDGVVIWIFASATGLLPPPPPHLLSDVVHIVAARRQPALARALAALAAVARRLPSAISPEHLDLLLLGLEQLADETALPTGSGRRWDAGIPRGDRPRHRRAAIELATALSTLADASTGRRATVIGTWRVIGQTDPLPEVRRAWQP